MGAGARCSTWSERSIARSAERMLRYDAGVRLGEDPEAVHQARVATRRLRSDLRTFRSLLDPEWTADCARSWVGSGAELGTVRDLDVLGERLRGRLKALPDDDAEAAPEAPRPGPHANATRPASDLMSAMREPRYLALLDRVVAAPRASRPSSPTSSPPMRRDAMGALMEGPWRHLQRICRQLGPGSADAELHEARIRAKRVRYAAEA